MSAASRPVAMRTKVCRGARSVPSTTRQCPSTNASATAWKSIGYRPGAYTDTTRAGTLTARSSATTRCAKSRHTPAPASKVSAAPSIGSLDPGT